MLTLLVGFLAAGFGGLAGHYRGWWQRRELEDDNEALRRLVASMRKHPSHRRLRVVGR